MPDSSGVEEPKDTTHSATRELRARAGRGLRSPDAFEFALSFPADIASAGVIPRAVSQTLQEWDCSTVLPTAHGGALRTVR
jgi:hypothetical protein